MIQTQSEIEKKKSRVILLHSVLMNNFFIICAICKEPKTNAEYNYLDMSKEDNMWPGYWR